MMRTMYRTLGHLGLALAALGLSPVATAAPQFSADTLQRGPDGKPISGKIMVGDGRMRSEMVHQGQQVIRITDEKRGVEWVLFPERKSYMERRLAGSGGQPMATKPTADDPCAGMPGTACKKRGEESVSGRTAVVWEIVGEMKGKRVKGTQWIDKERGPSFMLRQELPTGQKMERTLVGQDSLSGRQTEKWKIEMTGPDGQTLSTFEWYDPELEISLKQEFPGGMVSELTNIRVGPQPDQLFGVPAGYERISMPKGIKGQTPQR